MKHLRTSSGRFLQKQNNEPLLLLRKAGTISWNEITLRVYYALDEAKVKARRNNDCEEAEKTAHELLAHADLPLMIIRARVRMVIAFSDEPHFLEYAKEAVRIAEMAASATTTRV